VTSAGSIRRRGAVAAAFAGLAAALIAVGVAIPGAEAAAPKVLGKTKNAPKPACPEDCTAFVSATGFQVEANGKKGLFKAKEDGKIVAWSVDVSKPNKSQRKFFGDNFSAQPLGDNPGARIAVLKPLEGTKFRLKDQSPLMSLEGLMGKEQTFTLNNPIPIKEGEILGLTVPTWLPALASGLDRNKTAWRASRKQGKCGPALGEIKEGKPQDNVDSKREYGCTYNLDRLLYWGYYIPD
jgi:hypothetical protein